jgi:hypothetical protein
MLRSIACAAFIAALGCSQPMMRDVGREEGAAPTAHEARVIVYRLESRNAHRSYAVYDGETLVGMAESGRRFEYRCSPGEHLFYIAGTSDAAVKATLAGGRTYYLRAGESPTWFRLRMVLEPLGSEAASADAGACVRTELDPWRADAYRRKRDAEVSSRVAHFGANSSECGIVLPHEGR